ncbi:MAG: hypothetical protein WDW38_000096 [Sanguina aurantia]
MDIYYYTVKAIKASGLQVMTGGPAGANPADTLSWAATLLSNSNISTDIHFLSYHSSDDDDGLDATYGSKYKAFLLNQNRTDIETYVTEWTFRYQDPNNPENGEGTIAIPYAGRRLTAFLASGVNGACIFNMAVPLNDSNPGQPAIPTSSSTIHATASITPTPSLAIPSIIALASPSPLTARTT